MKARNLNNKLLQSQASFGIFPLLAILLMTVVFIPAVTGATNTSQVSQQKPPELELRVDAGGHARAFCNGIKAVVSITNLYEFYVNNLDGSRKRICSGPWQGSLMENYPGTYTLKGSGPASGAAYNMVVFKQVDSSTVELYMTFKAPNRKCNLGFDILKLAGDLFKGAAIAASPAAINDVSVIPVDPLPVANRMLFMRKNSVLLKGTLCDFEIKDLNNTGTMLAADFRSISWDTSKSIYFGAEKTGLEPGEYYSFRYSIRCLPPSQAMTTQSAAVTAFTASLAKEGAGTVANPWSFYSPPSKYEARTSGGYQVQPQDVIFGIPTGAAETVLARELAKLTSMRLAVKPSATSTNDRGIYLERIPKGAANGRPAEGFEIVATPEKIVVRGADERGCLYGVYALMGRVGNSSGSWGIDCVTIRDWPDMPVRGVCLEELAPAIRDVSIVKRYLDAFSRARSNVVIFLHNPSQMRSWLKNRDDGGWTKEQMAEIADYARSLQMDVWGGMGSHFDYKVFPELQIRSGTNLYNPFIEESYQNLFNWCDQILNTYHPSTILISHDEIMGLSTYAALSGKSTAEILSADVTKIHDWLAHSNVRTAMWSDMLLDYTVWEAKVGAANSLNPYFNSGATRLALQKLPSDIMILDWHYGEKSDYASIDYFRHNGFSVAGSPWYDPKAAASLARSAKKYGGQGIITTDWGFLRTFSPAATTLYAPLCAWSTNCALDQSNNDVSALADTVRDDIYKDRTFKQTAVSLASASNRSTVDISGGNGIFDIGPFLDLSAFPSGKQVLGGVSFAVESGNSGHRNNCVVAGNTDDQSSGLMGEKPVFQGDQRAQAVAFLHTCFVEEPQYTVRKLGRYIVEYKNGTTGTIELQENWNITDVRSSEGLRHNSWSFTRSPEILIGSKPAWRGNSASGIPLNVQMFIWKNPYPEQKIQSIRLSAANAPLNSRIAVLGLTFLQ